MENKILGEITRLSRSWIELKNILKKTIQQFGGNSQKPSQNTITFGTNYKGDPKHLVIILLSKNIQEEKVERRPFSSPRIDIWRIVDMELM